MKVTPEILKALNRAKDYYGNTTQLAKHLGIAHSTILFWFSGKTKNISGQLWCRLLKEELAPFMADSDEKRKEQGRTEVYCVPALNSCSLILRWNLLAILQKVMARQLIFWGIHTLLSGWL